MTEDEALKKWCPFARDAEPQCIASSCMAWRIRVPAVKVGDMVTVYNEDIGDLVGEQAKKATPERGYCGLAGKP